MRAIRILTFIVSSVFLFIGASPLIFLPDVTVLFRNSLQWLGIVMMLFIFSGMIGIISGIILGIHVRAGRVLLLVATLFSGFILSPYLLIYLGIRRRNIRPLVEPLYPWQGSKTWPDSFH